MKAFEEANKKQTQIALPYPPTVSKWRRVNDFNGNRPKSRNTRTQNEKWKAKLDLLCRKFFAVCRRFSETFLFLRICTCSAEQRENEHFSDINLLTFIVALPPRSAQLKQHLREVRTNFSDLKGGEQKELMAREMLEQSTSRPRGDERKSRKSTHWLDYIVEQRKISQSSWAHAHDSIPFCMIIFNSVSFFNYFFSLFLFPFPHLCRIWKIKFSRPTSGSSTNGRIISSNGIPSNMAEWRSSTSHRSTYGYRILCSIISKSKSSRVWNIPNITLTLLTSARVASRRRRSEILLSSWRRKEKCIKWHTACSSVCEFI